MKHLTLLFILMALVFAGCKKYPDDERKLHLKFPLNRICHQWILISATNKSTGVAYAIPSADDLTFDDGMQVVGTSPVMMQEAMGVLSIFGGWEFTDKNSKLVVTEYNSLQRHTYEIRELEKKKMKLRNDTADFYFERS